MPIAIGSDSIYGMSAQNAKESAKAASVQKRLTGLDKEASDEDLLNACKEFESYLVEKMLTALEKTVPKEEEENEYEAQFKDMLYQEYAGKIMENDGVGLAKQLYEAMKRNNESMI